MKLWYKDPYSQGLPPFLVKMNEETEFGHVNVSTEPPGIQSKNGYHLVVTQSDLPMLSGLVGPAASQGFPSTLQAIHIGGWMQGIYRLEKAVGLSLAFGYVGSGRSRLLLQRLSELGQAFDMLHQELQYIPADKLRLIDEAEVSKK